MSGPETVGAGMNAFEYTLCRFARRQMTKEERGWAQKLARRADAGDKAAEAEVKTLAERVFLERRLRTKR